MRSFVVAAGVLFLVLGLCAGHALSDEPVNIQVSPGTISLDSQGEWVTVHADIPYRSVVTVSLTLNGVEIAWTKADAQLDLVAKFNVDDVKKIVAPPSATLELKGFLVTGEPFSGSDTIKVIAPNGKK